MEDALYILRYEIYRRMAPFERLLVFEREPEMISARKWKFSER